MARSSKRSSKASRGSQEERSPEWYAVHTKPNGEDLAELNLRRQGFGVVYPWYWGERTIGRKMLPVRKPWFSRYMFVCLARPWQSLQAVNSTLGVATVIHLGEQPLVVPISFVFALMARAEIDGSTPFPKPPVPPAHPFRKGDFARFKVGHLLEGIIAEIDDVDDRTEIGVFVQAFGRMVATTVPASDLEMVASVLR